MESSIILLELAFGIVFALTVFALAIFSWLGLQLMKIVIEDWRK